MKASFVKYQALGNDFLILEGSRTPAKAATGRLARDICDRREGIGADGILYLSPSRKAEIRVDVFNADGSWAEKSGNGLRIVGVYLKSKKPSKKAFAIEMGGTVNPVQLVRKIAGGFMARAEIGRPDFRASAVPMKSKFRYHINRELKVGKVNIWATCLAVGNPHCVVLVDHFNFDWEALGREIETSRSFPRGTNVEFVQIVNRSKIRVAEWERGAGATGSSGTGAAAAVASMVIHGLVDRKCEVVFKPGSLQVEWLSDSDTIALTGPVEYVGSGEFEHR